MKLDTGKTAIASLIAWHVLVATALALGVPQLKFHLPLWGLKASEASSIELLLAGYVVAALLPVAFALTRRKLTLVALVTGIVATFGVIFLFFLVRMVESSRIVMVEIFFATLVSVPLALLLGRLRIVAVVLLALFVGFVLVPMRLAPREDKVDRQKTSAITHTALLNLSSVTYRNYFPPPAVRGGAMTRFGDDVLLATGDGFLYLLHEDEKDLSVQKLAYRVPLNGDEFAQDTTGGPWHTPREGDPLGGIGEDAGTQVIAWWFRATDILVQEVGDRVRVFAVHHYWKRDQKCWVVRVSVMEGAREQLLAKSAELEWRTLFESSPCLTIKGDPEKGDHIKSGTPFCGHFGGGRLKLRDPSTLLLTVGDFGFNGVASKWAASQDLTASYGKTILIDANTGSSKLFTVGNRNPEGLYIDPSGAIWETEHGPQGGDELNRLRQDKNYGWPYVTYGVDYGTFQWPLNSKQGDHLGFEAPFYAWVPSIGVSNLIGIEKQRFAPWQGDLLVASLAGQSLYRLRVREDRVAYSEPLLIGRRIRDVVEAADGRVLLWADDDNAIVSLQPAVGNSGEVAFATYCSGCHKLGDGTSHRIGPDLWGVVGRKVASAEGYADYSGALHAFGGVWTRDRVDTFVKNPQAAVPGTGMQFQGVPDDAVRGRIIDYIQSAKKVASK